MDPLILMASSALAAGDPLRALNHIALREDAPALALRGIAMAQLGDLAQARHLLKRAAGAFGAKNPVAHARCVVAQAEVALVSRDLGWPVMELDDARSTLEQHGDVLNAVHARHLQARRALLLGDTEGAELVLEGVPLAQLPPLREAAHEMIVAGLAMQRLRTGAAKEAYARAGEAARKSGISALVSEVESAAKRLKVPAARHIKGGGEELILLGGVESLLASGELVIDACRMFVRRRRVAVPLATRPVLFTIVRALAEAWPEDVSRSELIRRAFESKVEDESHRVRLRVEVGRLRRLLKSLCEVRSTGGGFVLEPCGGGEVHVISWPVEERHGAVLAFLADGEAWSSSALALALGTSQRTVQRALDSLAAEGKVQWFGKGRARRWTSASVPGFTTTMLLPSVLAME
jgi:hypothetical protein